MDEAAYLKIVRGESRGPGALVLRAALAAASVPYRAGVAVRNFAFDRGWRAIHRAAVPVISIGNITLGGTGKTPAVEWVAHWFRKHYVRVAILSRGYGSEDEMNDEGRVLEENLPDVPHLQGRDRAALAQIAVEELESELLILDDGFQHRRLHRDLDIVLIDALEPFGVGRMFPRGLLREPVRALRRANLVILSRADLVTDSRRQAIREQAERLAGPLQWSEARHAPRDLIGGEQPVPLERLAGAKIAAFCGIGNPDGFRKTLTSLGVVPIDFRLYPDHYRYGSNDATDLARWGESLGADILLTTQKDWVKLRTGVLGRMELRALRVGLELIDGQSILEATLAGILPKNPS